MVKLNPPAPSAAPTTKANPAPAPGVAQAATLDAAVLGTATDSDTKNKAAWDIIVNIQVKQFAQLMSINIAGERLCAVCANRTGMMNTWPWSR